MLKALPVYVRYATFLGYTVLRHNFVACISRFSHLHFGVRLKYNINRIFPLRFTK